MSRLWNRIISIFILSMLVFSFAACQSTSTTSAQEPLVFIAPSVQRFWMDSTCVPSSIVHDQSRIAGDAFGAFDIGNVGHVIKANHQGTQLLSRDTFVDKDSSCLIYIDLYNPDELVIESIVVSDVIYPINSNVSPISITVALGDEVGVKQLELQTITYEYADKVGTYDFLITPKLHVGVLSRSMPTIWYSNLVATDQSISFTAEVTDPDGTALVQNALLYNPVLDVYTIIELSLGTNQVEFTELVPDTEYQVILYSGYDPYAYREVYFVFHHVVEVTTE
jgi:hypothetical protein